MNILSIIYSIPAAPYPSTLMYSAMTDSTASTSPTNSASPSSDSLPQIPDNSGILNSRQNDYHHYPLDENSGHEPGFDGTNTVNSVMFTLDDPNFTQPTISGLPPASHHPYAIQYDPPPQATSGVSNSSPNRRSARTRALSSLPPPPPPPSNSLPPAPTPVVLEPTSIFSSQHLDVRTHQQGESIGHRSTGSTGLDPLKEEYDDSFQEVSRQTMEEVNSRMDTTHLVPDTPRNSNRDSHPLPPLPSPSTGSPGTPRNTLPASKPPPSPRLSNIVAPRPRGSSQLTTRSEIASQPHVINSTTTQGTIFQRRTKISAPPSSRSSSPADSTMSAGSVPQARAGSSLPGAAPIGMLQGRSRSSSQPGRRPSLGGGRISPLDQRPPLPSSAGVTNGAGQRKTSIPSKLNPNPQLSQLSVQTDLPQPPYGNGSLNLVPPPPVFTGNLPTTPTSPLPPTPPSDPLLKPYHLMNLLRITMTSTTGGYLTRRLHVPHEVWSQGGAKLSNVGEKVRVVAILCSALEDLQTSSSEHFGAGNVSSGLALGIGSVGRKEADAWITQLDNFLSICDGVVTDFGKKLGVGEGFIPKKAKWQTSIVRGFDKFTTGKK
jgi:hypothetical protein